MTAQLIECYHLHDSHSLLVSGFMYLYLAEDRRESNTDEQRKTEKMRMSYVSPLHLQTEKHETILKLQKHTELLQLLTKICLVSSHRATEFPDLTKQDSVTAMTFIIAFLNAWT